MGTRLRKRPGELFAAGSTTKHFAVVSNIWEWSAPRLREWPRGKAGTLERVPAVLKNDLAAGVLPGRRLGVHAAWRRRAVLSPNVLTAWKRLALPPELWAARPQRWRFLIFNTPGRWGHHARKMRWRLAATRERLAEWREARRWRRVPVPG